MFENPQAILTNLNWPKFLTYTWKIINLKANVCFGSDVRRGNKNRILYAHPLFKQSPIWLIFCYLFQKRSVPYLWALSQERSYSYSYKMFKCNLSILLYLITVSALLRMHGCLQWSLYIEPCLLSSQSLSFPWRRLFLLLLPFLSSLQVFV